MNFIDSLESFARELRLSFRQLYKSPAFTLTAVATLTLGIGANTVVFSVLNTVLLRPLPFPNADRLVRVFSVKDGTELGPSAVDVRDFSLRNHTSDTETSPVVAIVNQAFVNRYLAKRDPIGQKIELGAPPGLGAQDVWLGSQNIQVTVIGVMRDSKNLGLAVPIEPQLITLFRQMPVVNFGFKDIMVRSEIDPNTLGPTLQQELRAIDPAIPLSEVSSMQNNIQELTSDKWFTGVILASFATLGVVLAAIGVYGVVSYHVAQRTQELGIRLALGAMRSDISWLILRQGLLLALIGVGAGLVGVALVSRSLSSLVYDISPVDTLTLLTASLVITLVAVIASAIPVGRAVRIDPIKALRAE